MLHLRYHGECYQSLTNPAAISAVIAKLEDTDGAFLRTLYRAALAGELRLLTLMPGGHVPARMLVPTALPTVIVLSGDLGHVTPAPEAFPQALRLVAWAASTVIHGTDAKASHYAAVGTAACLVRRVLLVETATDQEGAWVDMPVAEHERRACIGRGVATLAFSARVQAGVHPTTGGRA